MTDQKPSPEFLLGEIYADVKWIKTTLGDHKKTDDSHEERLTSLEKTRFKAAFIITTIASTVSGTLAFLFAKYDKGIEWLKNLNG